MARYENLPIFRKAMELAVAVEEAVRRFPRYHKYAIGADLRHGARRLVSLIIRANSQADKVASLTELRDGSEEMKVMIVMAREVKAFAGFKEFERLALLATEISRQSEGWLRSRQPG
ncbi:MAG: four helix bundle protein [Thermodesulfobacteriota bacterium]